ncbi:type 4a pilus biogenesis protein PilO [Massilia sp. W12]|uniref:type 4a pilus biogenesis protein PilO n=1 Tax=Massilia sp. W12 TaxID=3126507 RepID=UPI0030D30E93
MANIDLANLNYSIQNQFRGLNGRHPGLWPILPRILVALGVVLAMVVLGYFLYWQGQLEQHEQLVQEESKLRADFQTKMTQAVNLEALQEQKKLVAERVSKLEKKLPSKASMDSLLSEINQAGVGMNMVPELFQPQSATVKEYYAELPIKIKVFGTYHDIALFAQNIAKLSRIVTLNDMILDIPKEATQPKDGSILELDVTAKTFRYLDPEEVAAQRKATEKDKKGAKK